MNYQVLARKWRPKVFADVIGQSAILQALQFALQSGRLHHAYLFTGTRGVGKTTLARILAKALSCEQGVVAEPCNRCANCQAIDAGNYPDVIEIDAASRTKVEDTRELLDNVPYAPVVGRYKIYIIDEVHMLSNHSFNALLKTLEEPPAHIKFIFATTDPHKLPVTILSRCLQFQLSSFNSADLAKYLAKILAAESIQFEQNAVTSISIAANGSVRDALTLLEQVIALGQENITEAIVAQVLGIANHDLLLELLSAIINADPAEAIACINRIQQEAADLNKVLQELLVIIHKIAMVQVLPEYLSASDVTTAKILTLAKLVAPEIVQLLYQIGLNGKKDLNFAPDLSMGFSMIILRMLTFQPLTINNNKVNAMHSAKQGQNTGPSSVTVNKEATKPLTATVTTNKRGNNVVEPQNQMVEANADCAVNSNKLQKTATTQSAAIPSQQHSPPDWDELIYQMKLSGLTKAVAQHCVITGWKGGNVNLTLDPVHGALLQPHHEQKLQIALANHLKQTIKLKITIGQVLTETPAIKQSNLKAQKQQAAEDAIRKDPLVQEILQTFDAKLERVIVKDEILEEN